jgi:hypothetical protein
MRGIFGTHMRYDRPGQQQYQPGCCRDTKRSALEAGHQTDRRGQFEQPDKAVAAYGITDAGRRAPSSGVR